MCTCEKGMLGQLGAGILCKTCEAIFLLCSALIQLKKDTKQTVGAQCAVMDATKPRTGGDTPQNKIGECTCRGAILEHK